ncbi:hypothetical protein M404DRAFT_993472 [Pisolithus tinctorius Marx 270]|uniref:Uncharacterized protein n=1 Tax=Pisolithus tinctorius Marx 270 TaxID=870435 RepID=A0A0C3KSJ5_PISTI|nr:hypothetical protein M404DRAFT_993472 [Pisolithus tinctorius Marx 270]
MKSFSDFPDEILHDILAHVFWVDEDVFACPKPMSSLWAVSEATEDGSDTQETQHHDDVTRTAVPLVCKRWLNVSTPLLYETVFLRTRPQVVCLARTLLSDYTLGQNIRKLRVECGLGVPVNKILHFAPNIAQFVVELVWEKEEHTIGLGAGLQAINPSKIVLIQRSMPRYNRRISPLIAELCQYIPTWTKLTTLRYPYDRFPSLSSKDITTALQKIPHLRTLYVQCGYSIDTTLLVSLLGPQGDSITEIYSEAPLVDNEDSRMFLTLAEFSKLRQKVLFPVPGPWSVRPYRACAREDDKLNLIWTA